MIMEPNIKESRHFNFASRDDASTKSVKQKIDVTRMPF